MIHSTAIVGTRMSRFIIVDQALRGLGGHFYEFDRNVLDAAAASEFEPILIAQERCSLDRCGRWKILPLIRDGLWTHDHCRFGTRLLGRSASLIRRVRDRFPADRHAGFVGSALDGMRSIADQSLERVNAARDLGRIERFAEDLAGVVQRLSLTADDHVFLPNVLPADTLAIRRLLKSNAAARRPTWHLEYHVNLYPGGASRAAERHAEARYTRNAVAALRSLRDCRVFLYTDTDQLTAQHHTLAAGDFTTLPIPVDEMYRPSSQIRDEAQPLRIAFIGGGRLEKGFLKLEAIIRRFRSGTVAPKRIEFLIQANCIKTWGQRATWDARRRLMEFPAEQVRILPDVLGTDDYRRLVCESDVVLLPYYTHEYEARSSGIFAEAVAAGVPTVVTNGTWMAAEVHAAEKSTAATGPIGVVSRDEIEGFADAIEIVVARYADYRRSAVAYSEHWRTKHSGKLLVETLLRRSTSARGYAANSRAA